MTKYVAYVGKVRLTSRDDQKLREILRRDRDRRVWAERERKERAIRKEIRDFRDRYQDCVFRLGNAVGLLCTFRPREQQIIGRWWVDEEFTPPKPVASVSERKEQVYA